MDYLLFFFSGVSRTEMQRLFWSSYRSSAFSACGIRRTRSE